MHISTGSANGPRERKASQQARVNLVAPGVFGERDNVRVVRKRDAAAFAGPTPHSLVLREPEALGDGAGASQGVDNVSCGDHGLNINRRNGDSNPDPGLIGNFFAVAGSGIDGYARQDGFGVASEARMILRRQPEKKPPGKPPKDAELKAEVADRFRALVYCVSEYQTLVAKRLGVSTSQLSVALKGGAYPDEKMVVDFCNEFGVPMDMIYRGKPHSLLPVDLAYRLHESRPDLMPANTVAKLAEAHAAIAAGSAAARAAVDAERARKKAHGASVAEVERTRLAAEAAAKRAATNKVAKKLFRIKR